MRKIANRFAAVGALGVAFFATGQTTTARAQSQSGFPVSGLDVDTDGTLCWGTLINSPTRISTPMQNYFDPRTRDWQWVGEYAFMNVAFAPPDPRMPPINVSSIFIDRSGRVISPPGWPDFSPNDEAQIRAAAQGFTARCVLKYREKFHREPPGTN